MVILKLFLQCRLIVTNMMHGHILSVHAGFRPAVETSFYCIEWKKCKKDFVK